MLESCEAKQVEAWLSEYNALRSEIAYYLQRIDRAVGLYITAMFAIVAYLLRPGNRFDAHIYLMAARASDTLTSVFLIIPIVNSLLLMRIAASYLNVLTIARYLHYVVSRRVSALLRGSVMEWESSWRAASKKDWLFVRALGQFLFTAISEGVSISVLLFFHTALGSHGGLQVLYLCACFSVVASLLCFGLVLKVGRSFHKGFAA